MKINIEAINIEATIVINRKEHKPVNSVPLQGRGYLIYVYTVEPGMTLQVQLFTATQEVAYVLADKPFQSFNDMYSWNYYNIRNRSNGLSLIPLRDLEKEIQNAYDSLTETY